MLVLLPLRAWAGDAMALSELAVPNHTHPGTEQVAPSATAAPCHGETASTADTQMPTQGHTGCKVCEICHGNALVQPPVVAATGPVPRGAWPVHPAWFASAETRSASKPPIS
jgi:hypothetical protein